MKEKISTGPLIAGIGQGPQLAIYALQAALTNLKIAQLIIEKSTQIMLAEKIIEMNLEAGIKAFEECKREWEEGKFKDE